MRVSDTTLERVRQYHDIVAFVSHYVTLKRRGKNYIGLCPFHSEKSPSFTVSPDRHIFHCFGCHESGDLISFVQKIENLTFMEAIVRIAETVGIEVEYEQNTINPYADERDVLRDIFIAFREFCKEQLLAAKDVGGYLSKRGVSDASITLFQLGYCPSYFQVDEFCEKYRIELKDFLKSGLIYRSQDGAFVPRFRRRLMFPIFDHLGKVSGFGGRLLEQDVQAAKYVNSDDNPLFNKRRLLYGLDKAKTGIKAYKYALVVEGYMDVMLCHQHGFNHAVGIMGTALTTEQVQLLKRFTDTVYLALDSDASGQQAIEKSYHVLKAQGFSIYMVQMALKDPADILSGGDVASFKQLLDQAIPALEFMFEQSVRRYGTDRIEMVSKILQEIRPLLLQESDLVVRKHYVYQFAKRLNIDDGLILVNTSVDLSGISRKPLFNKQQKRSKLELAQEQLIFFLATHEHLRSSFLELVDLTCFEKAEHQQLVQEILGTSFENKELLESLENTTLKHILTQIFLQYDQLGSSSAFSTAWKECVEVVQAAKQDQRIELIKQKITQLEMQSDNDEEIGALLHELQNLNKTKRGSIHGKY